MNLEQKLTQLPDAPGIYLFYNAKKELIYVGKATSLRNRVRSYFSSISADRRGARTLRPIEQMIHEVVDIKVKESDSVLEAIVLERNYIKKYRPKYNIDWKDDKSWNYIVITKDDFPLVKTIRSHEMQREAGSGKWEEDFRYMFGPFPGMKTRDMMKLLQKLFFISICKPCLPGKLRQPRKLCRPCLYRQMGQCLGVCTGEISATAYRQKVIRPLAMFLRGNKKGVIKNLEKDMKVASKREEFEEAARLRNQIEQLQHIHDVVLLNKSFVTMRGKRDAGSGKRIEGYDISNLGKTGKVGSMVVFEDGDPKKSDYRKFKIKTVEGQSDVDCLEEVLRRRLAHADIQITNGTNVQIEDRKNFWPLPHVFLIDGGRPQVNRVANILKEFNLDIPVVGIAKGHDRKKNEFTFPADVKNKNFVLWVNKNQELLIRVRDEAHRFAIAYQRKLRRLKT